MMRSIYALLTLCKILASKELQTSSHLNFSNPALQKLQVATVHDIGALLRSDGKKALSILFVYTVVPKVCSMGLPLYIKESLEQAIFTQPDCDVYMASNYAECTTLSESINTIKGLKVIDTTTVISNKTRMYQNSSTEIFQSDNKGELWITSALRFFIMEDIMNQFGFTEIIHVEADNMLYGKLSSILSVLRNGYHGITATPLTGNKCFITASVFWVSSVKSLNVFNEYLLDIALNRNNRWWNYLKWLRKYACCKPGGLAPDKNGNGVKPFAVNEMSMLGYYHTIAPHEFKLLPVVPLGVKYELNRHTCDIKSFAPGGESVGQATASGIWDPNSWGQNIGGTAVKKGRNKGFYDITHVIGQAMRSNGCQVVMLCGNQSNEVSSTASNTDHYEFGSISQLHFAAADSSSQHFNTTTSNCYTRPFVRCASVHHPSVALLKQRVNESKPMSTIILRNDSRVVSEGGWTPLWNLHVHSKHTFNYRSLPCRCPLV